MEALGNRVIIKPDYAETKSKGGVIIELDEEKVKRETTTGIVVDYGPVAWLDPAMGGEPWVKRGDHVVYAKYAGKFITNPEDGKEYFVVNDDAIQVRLEK